MMHPTPLQTCDGRLGGAEPVCEFLLRQPGRRAGHENQRLDERELIIDANVPKIRVLQEPVLQVLQFRRGVRLTTCLWFISRSGRDSNATTTSAAAPGTSNG